MKKTIKKQEEIPESLSELMGMFLPKIIKSVPLKKHFLKQYEELKQIVIDLEKKKIKFWDKITKDVKAKPNQNLHINTEKSSVEFLES